MFTIVVGCIEQNPEPFFCKILDTESDIFSIPEEISESILYDSKTIPEDGLWFMIKDFSKQTFCLEFLRKSFASADCLQIDKKSFAKIKFLIAYRDDIYFFQRITPTKYVSKKSILKIGDNYEYRENREGIVIAKYPQAIYNKKKDTLYFQNLNNITQIFKGIDQLYRKATQEEVESFLAHSSIECSSNFSAKNVKTHNRKRIARIKDIFKQLSEEEKNLIIEYIREYQPEIVTENNKFHIASEADLKRLLYGLEERYFETFLGKKRYIANSIIALPPPA